MSNARTTALVGKAALHLACFHLARLGHDFTITREHSNAGDLWVNFGSGIEVVEVKGMTAGTWHLRAAQLEACARVIFVMVDDGACWIAAAADVREAMRGRAQAGMTAKALEGVPAVALHKQVGRVVPLRPKARPYQAGQKGARTVKKTLADGTVKVYRYGPYEPPIYNFQQQDNDPE
jgi:hypothetical protein